MRIIAYYLIFVVVYVVAFATTAMYFSTWGAKRNIFEKVYVFFFSKPFGGIDSLWSLPLNAIFWATVCYLLIIAIKKVKHKLR
ncbi:hypothetical protein [Pedobacter sp. Leaf176]|uniref:hypothetical protein n=1 Tax=Pedobacter sp. Leaf176 TaxID=1736286 RepID=UPI0006FEB9CB|nr:hypothetical protein [Pedobacter sp. Leaf176]KQR67232.1 hypothetical protein ASF92_16105 [Pedobacter sp. Leaf176]